MRLGIAKIDEQPIAEILGNMAVKALDDLGTGGLVGAHDLPQVFWVELAREDSGVYQVTEHHGELTAFCCRGMLDAGRRGTWGGMGFLGLRKRCTGGRERARRSGAGAASPDQHGVVLVHGALEHLDNFGFEILEVGVVEMKLALEGTIRHTPPALEHGNRLVEDLLKGHRQPSRGRCGVQKTVWELERPFERTYTAHGSQRKAGSPGGA